MVQDAHWHDAIDVPRWTACMQCDVRTWTGRTCCIPKFVVLRQPLLSWRSHTVHICTVSIGYLWGTDGQGALVKIVACIEASIAAAVQLDLACAADGAHVAAKVVTHHAHHALQLRQPLRLNRHSKLSLKPIQDTTSAPDLACEQAKAGALTEMPAW